MLLLWVVLVGAAFLALARRGRPTFHVAAETESITFRVGPPTHSSALVFPEVLYGYGEDQRRLTDVWLEVEDSVEVRLDLLSPDTLDVFLTSMREGRSPGALLRGGRRVTTLATPAHFRAPLSGEMRPIPFHHAMSVQVGNAVPHAAEDRVPVLRSGTVRIADRTVFGEDFDAVTRDLRLGEVLEVPTVGLPVLERASGVVLVDPQEGMSVTFTVAAPTARIAFAGRDEVLTTPWLERLLNDRTAVLLWTLVLFLVLQPIGSILADLVRKHAESSPGEP